MYTLLSMYVIVEFESSEYEPILVAHWSKNSIIIFSLFLVIVGNILVFRNIPMQTSRFLYWVQQHIYYH